MHSGLARGWHTGQPHQRQREESLGLKQHPQGGQQLWDSFHFPHL